MKKILTLKRNCKKNTTNEVQIIDEKRRNILPIKTDKPRRIYPIESVLVSLNSFWPLMFPLSIENIKPMKIGIFDDMRADIDLRKLSLSATVLRRCLLSITQHKMYKEKIIKGAFRYDLNGKIVGIVNREQAEYTVQHQLKNIIIIPLNLK